MWGSDRSGSDRSDDSAASSYNRSCQLVATSSPAPSVSSAPPLCPFGRVRSSRRRPRRGRVLGANDRVRVGAHRHRPAWHRRDARSPAPRRRRDRRHLRRLRAQPGEGRRRRAGRREARRLPAHPRRQGHRRRRHRHARSLARADDRAGLQGRQGRLRREADLGRDRRRPHDGRRRRASTSASSRSARSSARARTSRRPPRSCKSGAHRRRHAGPLLERRQLAPKGIGNPPDSAPPAGLDWDMWLGPAPKVPFNPNRFGVDPDAFSHFRWFWDYAGGMMTDWGVHLIDIVQMGDERRRAARGLDDRRQVPPQRQPRDAGHDPRDLSLSRLRDDLREPGLQRLPINGRDYGIEFHRHRGDAVRRSRALRAQARAAPRHRAGHVRRPDDRDRRAAAETRTRRTSATSSTA